MGLGLAIKYYRLRAGLKQKDLASRVGISAALLSLVEADRRQPTVKLLERIADELGLPVPLLLLEEKQDHKFSPEQLELFDRAKRLFLLASELGENAKSKPVQGRSAISESQEPAASRAAPESSPPSSRKRRGVSSSSLRSTQKLPKEGRKYR